MKLCHKDLCTKTRVPSRENIKNALYIAEVKDRPETQVCVRHLRVSTSHCRSRLPGLTWPDATKAEKATPLAAICMSAESNTTTGALPPSSAVYAARLRPTISPTARPPSVPPVKSTFRMRGCDTSDLPVTGPRPGRTERTPSGRPASRQILASSKTVIGAS